MYTKEQGKQLHQLNIRNGARIAEMRHGEYLSIGTGNVVFDVFCYEPVDYPGTLRYDFEVKHLGERVKLIHGTSLAHTLIEFADRAWEDYS